MRYCDDGLIPQPPPHLAPGQRLSQDEAARWWRARDLEERGARLCVRPGQLVPTTGDLDTVEWFMAWCAAPGQVPYPGCGQCERTTALDLEAGQVASCGEHSYVRKGAPRDVP